jgi:hypothetical protein
MTKVNCSFCGKGMECPDKMLEKYKDLKHICKDCALKNKETKDFYKEFEQFIKNFERYDKISDEMVDILKFGEFWSGYKRAKHKFTDREMAEDFFKCGISAFLDFLNFTGIHPEFFDKLECVTKKYKKLRNETKRR